MSKELYLRLMAWFSEHKTAAKTLSLVQKVLELGVYVAYPAFIIYLIVTQNEYFIRSLLCCGIPFVLVSLARKLINAKRPYEVYGAPAALKKDKKGESMPSRHAFAASIIAVNLYFVFPIAGILCGIAALIIAVLRVLLGVHFIRDVAAGLLTGLSFGIVGCLLF